MSNLRSAEAKGVLFRNTILLYVLQFSGYFFALASLPYQARVLGPEYFGKLGYAAAIMVFVELFVDFGFMLHATSEISKNRHDTKFISRVLTSATIVKVILSLIAIILVCAASLLIPSMRPDFWLYFFFLLSTVAGCFMPDFVYRGIESMWAITVRTILVKLFFTVMIFILLRKPSDYYLVPLLMLGGNTVAILGVYVHMHRALKVRFIKVSVAYTFTVFKEASEFFYSRIATALYGAANTMILGATSSGVAVGYYTSSDKLVGAAKSIMAPLADSVYPYMIRKRDFKLIGRILKITMPLITLACVLVFIFAEQICVLMFGKDFSEAGSVLRALMPVVLVTLPNYLLGFPTLGAMGLSKYANRSIFFAVVIQVLILACLFCTHNLSMIGLALAASASELSVLIFRCIVIYRNRNLLANVE